MNKNIHACVSYIVCRLITGRRISSLYDFSESSDIDISGLPDIMALREFDENHRDYIPGYASGCTYEHTFSAGRSIEIFINEKTFLVHIRGSSAYFIGNIQGDTIHLYDHKKSANFKYRISGFIDYEKAVETSTPDDPKINGGI